MIDTSLAWYEDIASEYYDPVRHPTCANFREASAILLKRWLQQLPHTTGWFCEVGAGCSLLAELLAAEDSSAADVIVTDSSLAMLRYSRRWTGGKTHLLLADSMMLPIADENLHLVVSSLGDPYNVPKFWQEMHRVLRPGGAAWFTTPSHDWAVAFRHGDNSNFPAEFELRDGERVYVPSWIYALPTQIKMIEKSGLRVKEHSRVFLPELTAKTLSPKLLTRRGPTADVVEGYLVAKPR